MSKFVLRRLVQNGHFSSSLLFITGVMATAWYGGKACQRALHTQKQFQRLQELSARLLSESTLDSMLEDVVTASMELLEGGKGIIQLYDSDEKVLRLIKQVGFNDEFISRFERLPISPPTACGTAFERKQRILIENVATNRDFAGIVPHLGAFGVVGRSPRRFLAPWERYSVSCRPIGRNRLGRP